MSDFFIEKVVPPLLVIALLGGLAAAAYSTAIDTRKFRQFLIERECVKVGEVAAEVVTGFGVGVSGSPTVILSSAAKKTGWKCNDGITYWR